MALIPLRGGSKGIPNKNIREIAGKPLASWVIEAAIASAHIDAVYVSTDSEKIKETVSVISHPKLRFIGRSPETSTDTASTESVMLEFASLYDFDDIVLIQATSPMLDSNDIDGGIEKYRSLRSTHDSLLSVVRQERFLWEDHSSGARPLNYDPKQRPRRQDFEGFLVENGAFYITSREALLMHKSRLSGAIAVYEMPKDTYFELDESQDWNILEALLQRKRVQGTGNSTV